MTIPYRPFKVKLFFQCGKKIKIKIIRNTPPRKSPLSEDSAIAETPPFFVHNCMCLSIKAVDNSKPFALVKMLMKIMMCG